MTEFPQGVRLAQAGDEKRVFDAVIVGLAENGLGEVDDDLVRDVIGKCIGREGPVLALIDGPERIEAMIALEPRKRAWYCTNTPENWCLGELFVYVHPFHRRSRHFAKLVQFARWWEEKTGLPVSITLLPTWGFEEKEKLFARYGKRVGVTFVVGDLGKAALAKLSQTQCAA